MPEPLPKTTSTTNMETPQTPQPTNTESSSKRPRVTVDSLKNLVPPDHPIYKRGVQIGFVSALPQSIKNSAMNENHQPQTR
jgi:hypothetical protein